MGSWLCSECFGTIIILIFLIDNHSDEVKSCGHVLMFGFDTLNVILLFSSVQSVSIQRERIISDVHRQWVLIQIKVVVYAIAYDATILNI